MNTMTMSAGRPMKRPSDSSDDSPTGPRSKLARLERGPEDFSSVVKSKLSSYTRTGQACDRCKVRKIRCDALSEGCSHCANQNLECYVTDRVTGRTERRGYVQELERGQNDMLSRIRELEQLLQGAGVEYTPFGGAAKSVSEASPREQSWTQLGSATSASDSSKPQSGSTTYPRYAHLESNPPESYLGVTSDNSPLSSIKGTTLSILGTTIDITSFDAPDMVEPLQGTPIGSPLYNKSVMAFLQSSYNINPSLRKVELPSRQDAFTYAEWYFLMIYPFTPVLHKPSFMSLLTRIYEDSNFEPSIPEQVTVHMVFAAIYFQYGARNREEPEKQAQYNELSNKHYHWCLTKTFDLIASQSVTAVQSLAMIAVHTRGFPKPGCSSLVSDYAMTKAIELNLHRAVKIPGGGTNIDNEIRRRVWWVVLGMAVTLNGRLGRPMPIAIEDFDVDLPVAIADEYLSDQGITDLSKIGQCRIMAGWAGFKTIPLWMEMYSNIYSVRRDPKRYVDVVRGLEQGMRDIQNSLPDDLRVEKCQPGTEIFALYTQAFCLEFQLCLRHPSVCITDDPEFRAENMRSCEENARRMLKVVGKLLKLKSLDTTWYQLSVYVAAIFSTLAARWERRIQATAFDILALREEMKTWMHIVYEICQMLGSGPRIGDEVKALIERTIAWIERDSQHTGGSPIEHQAAISTHIKQKQPHSPYQQNTKQRLKSSPSINGHVSPTSLRGSVAATNGTSFYDAAMAASAAAAFQSNLAYADHNVGNGLGGGHGSFDASDSSASQYMYAVSAAAAAAANIAIVDHQTVAAQSNPLIAFASQATAHVGTGHHPHHASHGMGMATGGAAPTTNGAGNGHGHHSNASTWHDWTTAIADNSADRYSANALLNLGTGRDVVGNGVGVGVDGSGAGSWPLILFHDGSGTVSGA